MFETCLKNINSLITARQQNVCEWTLSPYMCKAFKKWYKKGHIFAVRHNGNFVMVAFRYYRPRSIGYI